MNQSIQHTFCGGGVTFEIAADLSFDGMSFDSTKLTKKESLLNENIPFQIEMNKKKKS